MAKTDANGNPIYDPNDPNAQDPTLATASGGITADEPKLAQTDNPNGPGYQDTTGKGYTGYTDPGTPKVAQQDNPTGTGYQGTGNPAGYDGYGDPTLATVPTAGANGGDPVAGGTVPTSPYGSGFNTQIRDMLLKQLQGLGDPTTADSPDVQPAIAAFNAQSQRDQQGNRDTLAERFYAGGGHGLDSGGFNTAVQQGLEAGAADRANFTGTTVVNASNAKRQQLQQMLTTATNAGLTDQAQQIQQQLNAMDASLKQQGLRQQDTQFTKQLGQQDSQYYDALAQQYAAMIAQQNRDTLLAGLG